MKICKFDKGRNFAFVHVFMTSLHFEKKYCERFCSQSHNVPSVWGTFVFYDLQAEGLSKPKYLNNTVAQNYFA